MGLTPFTLDGLFAPLQAALDWMAGAAKPRFRAHGLPAAPAPASPGLRRAQGHFTPRRSVRRSSAGPVRVLRLVDGQAPASAGRMVITGRMADVCAELDRLAGQAPLRRG